MWNMSLIFTSFVLWNTPELIEQTRKFVMIVKKKKMLFQIMKGLNTIKFEAVLPKCNSKRLLSELSIYRKHKT